METKHTKGEWEIHGYNANGHILIGKSGQPHNTGKIVIVGWDCCGRDSEEWKANAKVISAAPTMLEALIDMVKWHGMRGGIYDSLLPLEEQTPEIQKAMLAIKKATE